MRQIYPLFLFCLLICSINHVSLAQSTGRVSGRIKSSDGKGAPYVNVGLAGTTKGTVTGEDGFYTIQGVTPGTYTVMCSFVGLQPQESQVTVTAGKTTDVDFELAENAAQISEVVVTAGKTQNKKPLTIGKIAISPLDMPQSMSIINSEVIADQQASKLSDVIKNVNGVALGTTRGSTAETFFARGYNLGANNIFKNGARSNSAVIPEASTLERVEVLKGSAALLYGNVSGGAIINMVTKQPRFEYGGEVSLRAGSYNLFKPIADVYGPVSQNLAFRLIGTYETADSYRNSVESKRFYVNPSLLYKLGSRTNILVQGDYLNNEFTPDFGIGTLAGQIPTTIDRSAFFNAPWAYNKVKQRTTSATVDHQLNDTWKLNFIGSQQTFDRDYFSTERIQADADGDWGRLLTRSDISENYHTGQVNLNGEFKTFGLGHTILVGADAERYLNTTHAFRISSLGKGNVYDSINILNPAKFTPRTDEPLATATMRTETPTYRFGTYVQDLINVSEKFKVLAGLRWSYQKVAVAKQYNLETGEVKNSITATTKYDRAFSPRVGLVYQPTATTSFFASYSNNFTPNTGRDVYQQNLKPSLIDQFEVGVKNDLVKDRLSVNVTVYRIVNNDLALQAQYLADGVTLNTDATIKEFTGQTTSDGVEVDLNGSIVPGLTFLAGYSYNYMRYTDTPGTTGSYIEGERLVSNPAHTANATVFYTLKTTALKGLKIGASGFYTGERNAGWNNQVGQAQKFNRLIPVTGYTTFDVSLGYAIKQFSILGKLSNITNELNYLVHENYSVNPIPPRQFVTTLAYKF
ncbi:TonB-dependent receptor [Rufibacter aurantiacus]|uniref:TonB-dependent receptor n=1 Tax=Rufibacter aurantiacus TaxID=2817374 RepID=UPI001B30F2E8|nr:TonB-dependent receptor [Rufibacter aurantiacus]